VRESARQAWTTLDERERRVDMSRLVRIVADERGLPSHFCDVDEFLSKPVESYTRTDLYLFSARALQLRHEGGVVEPGRLAAHSPGVTPR